MHQTVAVLNVLGLALSRELDHVPLGETVLLELSGLRIFSPMLTRAAHAALHFATVPPPAVVAALEAGVERAVAGVPLEALPFRGEAQLQK